jgi:hypothetical protein
MKTLVLCELVGNHLGSRRIAAKLREDLSREPGPIALDLAGVEVLGHSFADELFGKLAEEYGLEVFKKRFILKNVAESDRLLIRSVVSARIEPSKAS